MKALVYQGPGQKEVVEKDKPKILQETDAIIKLQKSTICGTDLHILKGDVPTMAPGRTIGHEGVGIVEEVGSAVRNFKVGDKVIISCISACGTCGYCRKGLYSHCSSGGGWILGNEIEGTQAEYVRTPFADTSLYSIPAGISDDDAVLISDILPTGFEIGVQNGQVQPGDTIAIVGSGPIGLSALITSQFYSPGRIIMIDLDDNRLAEAKKFGATDTINSKDKEAAIKKVYEMTNGIGVDVAIEAVGIEPTFDICQKIVAPGGHVANVGVHGAPVQLHIEDLWIKNINIATGLVNTSTIPMILKTLASGKIPANKLITHHFNFNDIMKAYDVFGNAAKEKALKVIIDFD